MFKRFAMIEPQRGQNLLINLNTWMYQQQTLAQIIPIAADIFVFFYPIYLVGIYLYGIGKKKDYYKEAALYIFFAGRGAMFFNFIIKIFITKTRPDVVLNLLMENREGLLLESLPKNTFPSDHAAMSFAIATSSLVWGIKNKDRTFILWSLPLYVMACIMGAGRIMIGIHRPTDILMGIIVGIITPLLLLKTEIYSWLYKYLIKPLIKLQERLWKKLFGKNL